MTESEIQEILHRLQVLARSSPQDKKVLVEHLKKLDEVVAVTGDGYVVGVERRREEKGRGDTCRKY
jgi:hypothetical protein